MADTSHATEEVYLPFYIPGPGETDYLFIGTVIFVVLLIISLGIFYLHLHSLPDRMAHKANHLQLQVVGILTLLALFTHNNIYWVAALLLVSIQLPDFVTPLNSIARSLERGTRGRGDDDDGSADPVTDTKAQEH